jgi:ribosomal protein L32
MAVPKRKKTRSRRDMRRSHDGKSAVQIYFNIKQQKYARRHYHVATKLVSVTSSSD